MAAQPQTKQRKTSQRRTGPSEAEPGCLCFLVNRSAADPDRFVLYEQYADEAAFRAHRASAHFRANVEAGVVPLLAERGWERYDLVEPTPDA